MCNSTFRIRKKTVGRSAKRESSYFAKKILRTQTTLRGVADASNKDRETIRRRFHKSITSWKRVHLPAPAFTEEDGALILIVDGVFFAINDVQYVCLIILLRQVHDSLARLRGLVLVQGNESIDHWEHAFKESLTASEMAHIRAIVADGAHGLATIARRRNWAYQRCHFHLIKDLKNICGQKRSQKDKVRQKIFRLTKVVLNTPDEQSMEILVTELRHEIAHSECPETVRKKIRGFLRCLKRFRICYSQPELMLPRTSNAAECVARLIRQQFSPMHGINSVASLLYWMEIIKRKNPAIKCTPFINQISVS